MAPDPVIPEETTPTLDPWIQQRRTLQSKLEGLINSTNVYFQPPESVQLKYPCIVYKLSSDISLFAENNTYFNKNQYTLTIIDRSPESELIEKIRELSLLSFTTHFMANNLHHYVFSLYF